ncbi:MAG: DUF1570 domain-containing protein [Alcanivorax sp.]|nr:DUF1570 domain-containing protein [Alcanivorax sp.]
MALYAQAYQWRDPGGQLHFSDRPPAQGKATLLHTTPATGRSDLEVLYRQQDFRFNQAQKAALKQRLMWLQNYLEDRLGLDLPQQSRLEIYLLADQSAFRQWMQARSGNDSRYFDGVFIPGSDAIAVWPWSAQPGDIGQTLLHEGCHRLLAPVAAAAPLWLHEGLAQYFQTLRLAQGQAVVRAPDGARERLKRWIDEHRLISLRKYLALDNRHWQQLAHRQDNIAYTVAWATTAFLMSSPKGQKTLRRLLQDLDKSGLPPSAARVDALYPGGLTQLDYDFLHWAQGETPPQTLTLDN